MTFLLGVDIDVDVDVDAVPVDLRDGLDVDEGRFRIGVSLSDSSMTTFRLPPSDKTMKWNDQRTYVQSVHLHSIPLPWQD